MAKKHIFIFGILVIAVAVLIIIATPKGSSFESVNGFDEEITLYKSMSCGCCEVYAGYFKSKGNSNVKIVNTENPEEIRNKYGIPSELQSCHRVIIGRYFAEGHIPLEAIEKMLKEQPDIKGIAMPGMPMGSPGMPGAKEPFIIYQVNQDGSYEEFMRM